MKWKREATCLAASYCSRSRLYWLCFSATCINLVTYNSDLDVFARYISPEWSICMVPAGATMWLYMQDKLLKRRDSLHTFLSNFSRSIARWWTWKLNSWISVSGFLGIRGLYTGALHHRAQEISSGHAKTTSTSSVFQDFSTERYKFLTKFFIKICYIVLGRILFPTYGTGLNTYRSRLDVL